MTCNTILFVPQLIRKFFRQEFLDIFEDVCSLHMCFGADSFQLSCCTRRANVQHVFLRHPVYLLFCVKYLTSSTLPALISTIWVFSFRYKRKVFGRHIKENPLMVTTVWLWPCTERSLADKEMILADAADWLLKLEDFQPPITPDNSRRCWWPR